MGIFFRKTMLLMVAMLACLCSWGQGMVNVKKYAFADKSYISRMSDNGKWAVTASGNADYPAVPKIINLSTAQQTNIGSDNNDEITADITNDGSIVVGSYNGMPGFWNKGSNKWQALEVGSSQANATTADWNGGCATAVTPDGKYAVGYFDYNDFTIVPALWDLNTKKVIPCPGLPLKDMAHLDQKQMRFEGITPDGRYILVAMSVSYLPSADAGDNQELMGGLSYFLYDRQTSTYKTIGFKSYDNKAWEPLYEGVGVVDGVYMSNNGKYLSGAVRIYRSGDAEVDYYCPFTYDVDKDKFTVYEDETTVSTASYAISNNGTPLLSTPEGSPYRDWKVFDGKYWLSAESLIKQKYGVDIMTDYQYDNTGTAEGISDDGRRILATPDYTGDGSYVMDLPVSIDNVCEGVKVLNSYTVVPAEMSVISAIPSLTVTFDRTIQVLHQGSFVVLEDEQEKVVATATKNQASGKELSVTFRAAKATLEEGEHYYIHIPANFIAMESDASQTNGDIYIEYVGRKDGAMACTGINPAEGSEVAKINVTTNPITLTFDAPVKIAADETRHAQLYRNDETEPIAQMNFYYGNNNVMLAPASTVNLFKENTYRVEVPAGVITDMAGNGGNETISFTYKGAYEREISADDENLFTNNFDNRDISTAFMLYDGDQNVPGDVAKGWNFNKTLPWLWVRENTETDNYVAASHSMYSPAGKSDDWMVVPQLYIPDGNCDLNFVSQSYLKGAKDYLKIYVWESDKVYNTLTKDVVEKIKNEGNLEYNKLQSPGESEEDLTGEWTRSSISLKAYAGKSVYIAFVNDNDDQSAIFIDSIAVKHNMPILVAFDNEESVVNKKETVISGVIAGNNDNETYSEIDLTLTDANNQVIENKKLTGLSLSKGKTVKFAFDKALPLTVGAENRFHVIVKVGDMENTISKSIKDLVFQPVKRVVLEEFTGRDCSNCPLGIVAIENLQKRYGEKFLPIAIHGYTGDPLGSGLDEYYNFLQLNAAPSAKIDRNEGAAIAPMVSVNLQSGTQYVLSAQQATALTGLPAEDLWVDYVEKEMEKEAESDISVKVSYDANTRTISAPTTVRYALNTDNQYLNLFAVLVEQNVDAVYQQNAFSSIVSDVLLPWSKGGEYASAFVTGIKYQDVARATWGTTFNGTSGLLPVTMEAGKEYSTDKIQFVLPEKTDINPDNCEVIVMMFDTNSGKYINAARGSVKPSTGIGNITVDEAQNADNAWYTISGVKLSRKPAVPGLYIHQGKKFVIK